MNAPFVLPSAGIQPEIAMQAIPDDERVWVPQAQDVWFRPLLLNTVHRQLVQPAARAQERRALAPPPPDARASAT